MPKSKTQLIEIILSMSSSDFRSKIQLSTLLPAKKQNIFWRSLARLGDRLMGLNKLQRLYDTSPLPGLDKQAFAETLLDELEVEVTGQAELAAKLPKSGAVILVSNHPFGCIEGVAIADMASKLRSDVKVLANKALSMFVELRGHFIFINPLDSRDPANIAALKQCRQHLAEGGALVIFPAGKVSYFRPDKQRVCDDTWNRLPAQLAKSLDCPVLPLFVEGQNSRLFINLGRVYYRFKLLMLFREMLKARGRRIEIKVGRLLPTSILSRLKSIELINAYLRAQTYLLQNAYYQPWPADEAQELKPLMEPTERVKVTQEINALPGEQHLVDYKTFSVYYGYQSQMPNVVMEIARLRERVFRTYNEGSGEAVDTDLFDASYTHMFIFDNENSEIIGAYRMGQTDKLIAEQGIDGLYLSRMFDFSPGFINRNEPCLEMGRSFIVPEHQRSFYGLFLLWRGIGEFVVRHPRYRTLYGTVSISKLYSPHSVDCISALSLKPSDRVKARMPFVHRRHPELQELLQQYADSPNLLSLLVQGIETDGKDVPILMKQYEKMAARFYCIGIDKNFNHTPGLLLSVTLPKAPRRALKQYLADGLEGYLNFNNNESDRG